MDEAKEFVTGESDWASEEGDEFSLAYEEVMGEWEGEGFNEYLSITPPDDRGDLLPNDCLCDPCQCDDSEDKKEEQDVEDCTCPSPCPCEDGSEKAGRDETPPPRTPEPSCSKGCLDGCRCHHVSREESKEDPMITFVQKLEDELATNQRRMCRSVFPRLKSTVKLTEGLLLDLLVRDVNGKSAIYLPGNQLYPSILSDRLHSGDMRVISNLMGELPDVTTISVPYNRVGDEGMDILASVLLKNPAVENLNVMNNEVRGKGLLRFCTKIMQREPLLSLRLSGNKFGDEGYEALSCLVLSGHIPLDLDLSETDMGVRGFQALCAALTALDCGDDYPSHYVIREKKLPMDLEILKRHKTEYNDNVHKMNAQRTDAKSGSAKFYSLNIPVELLPTGKPEKVPPVPQYVTPEIAGKFSATVLERLFDISERKDLVPPDPAKLLNQYPMAKVSEAIGQGDLDDFIASLSAERNPKPKAEKVVNYREIPILSRDLYTIQPVKEVYHEFLHDLDNPDTLRSRDSLVEPSAAYLYRGQVIDPTDSILDKKNMETRSSSGKPISARVGIDDQTVEAASKKYVKGVIEQAAATVGASEVDDQTNVVQLVLMTIVEIVHRGQLARLAGGGDGTLLKEDCRQITEEAIDRVMTILEPRVPIGCELSQETVRLFIESLFDTTEGTFINLLENPFIMEALHETGTLACHVQALRDKKGQLEVKSPLAPPDKIQYLVTKFLDGVLEEAGRMIGTGDPFNYRSLPTDEYMGLRGESEDDYPSPGPLDPIVSLVDDLLDMGRSVGLQTIVDTGEARRAEKDYTQASEIMVENLFKAADDFVTSGAKQTQQQLLEVEAGSAIGSLRYPYVSRPRRLVLNRPLLHPGEQVEVAAMMLGDYLKDNFSVKDLHMQKWQLNETGMVALMEERVMNNRSLVFLDLSNNELGTDGIKLLANYITLNSNLKHLIISHNRLRDPGISHIAGSLVGSNLESLNVAFNDLTEIGLDHLLSQIPLCSVTALYLWGNGFGLRTVRLYKGLLDSGKIMETDTFVQTIDGVGSIVKNGQVRDRNFWYEVPAIAPAQLTVPPYLKKKSTKPNQPTMEEDLQ